MSAKAARTPADATARPLTAEPKPTPSANAELVHVNASVMRSRGAILPVSTYDAAYRGAIGRPASSDAGIAIAMVLTARSGAAAAAHRAKSTR